MADDARRSRYYRTHRSFDILDLPLLPLRHAHAASSTLRHVPQTHLISRSPPSSSTPPAPSRLLYFWFWSCRCRCCCHCFLCFGKSLLLYASECTYPNSVYKIALYSCRVVLVTNTAQNQQNFLGAGCGHFSKLERAHDTSISFRLLHHHVHVHV